MARGARRSITMSLLIANVAAFGVQMVTGGADGWFTRMFLLDSSVWASEPWRLVTSMFLHGSVSHLLINMYVLYMFGMLIENRIGSRRFTFIYFASGVIASLAAVQFYNFALGASGAIMGILGVTIMLMPDLRVLLFFFVPMTMRTAGIVIALLDLFGFLPGVAHAAHLGGLAAGLAYGYHLSRQKARYARRVVRVHDTAGYGSERGGMEMTKQDMEDFLRYGRL